MTLAPSPDRATEARAASAEEPAGRPWWRSRPHWLRVGASLAGGVATAVAFPPFDAGPLVLVALVPLLWAWRDARLGPIGGGTSEIMKEVIGRLMGL